MQSLVVAIFKVGHFQSSPLPSLFPLVAFRRQVVDSNVFPEANCMDIQRVGIVGAGTMGNGIAHVFARSGYKVVLCDVEQRFLDRALDTIGKNLDREVAKSKITADDKSSALGRITPVVDRAKLAECHLVVEAVT